MEGKVGCSSHLTLIQNAIFDLIKPALWLIFLGFLIKSIYYKYTIAFSTHWDVVFIKDLVCDPLALSHCEAKNGMSILKDVYMSEDFGNQPTLTHFEQRPNGKKIQSYELIINNEKIISKARLIKAMKKNEL